MAGNSAKIVVIAFAMNMAIAIAKYIAFLFTGSAAMMAESVHSLADTTNQIFLYLGLKKSKRAASDAHQFGYGMEQYIFSFLVAILIFSLGGAYSLYEGVHKLIHPSDKLDNAMINLIVLGVAILLEGYSSYAATKELAKKKGSHGYFKYISKTKDQVLVTVIFEDYAALLGLVIASIGIGLYMITGDVFYDSLATLFIGLLLVVIAIVLYKQAKSLLVGEAASPEDQEKIKKAFSDHSSVEKLTELLTMHLSVDQILVNAHVKFASGLTLEEVEDIIDEIEEVIIKEVPEVYKIFIETHQKDEVSDLQQGSGDGKAAPTDGKRKSVIRNSSKRSKKEGSNED